MAVQTQRHTIEEFQDFINRPENRNRQFEFIGGRIVEVVSNNYSSEIAMLIGAMLLAFAKERGLGRVTGADGGYVVAGEHYIPDAAFISIKKQPEPSREAYNPNAPDLAVEVLTPSSDPGDMRIKVVNYLHAGATVWVVDPEKQIVEVYVPGQTPKTASIGETLDGGDVLPDFKLPVKEIFPA